MKFLHTSDLHLGKSVNDLSMLEDQRVMLHQISGIAKEEAVDAVIIAGDVYDRSIPPAEAVTLFSHFLNEMVLEKIPVLIISGNHDSPERLSFADKPLEKSGIYITGGSVGQDEKQGKNQKEEVRRVTLYDELGPVHFFMLPFFKPATVGEKTSEEAVRRALAEAGFGSRRTADASRRERAGEQEGRNVLITHFFVTAGGRMPELSEAESSITASVGAMKGSADGGDVHRGVSVGNIDNIDASLFSEFDYTALGHIHKAQKIGEDEIYYSGAPLAYSFSEAGSEKSVQLVTLLQKGEVTVEKRILRPLHSMRIEEGFFEELLKTTEPEAAREDYIQARLLDREELIDPIGQLRAVYPNIMQIVFAGRAERERTEDGYEPQNDHRTKSMQELFGEFYNLVRKEPMEEAERKVVEELARELEREEEENG